MDRYVTILKTLRDRITAAQVNATYVPSDRAAERYNAEIVFLQDIKKVLGDYVQPWRCPDCGDMVKLPQDDANPRKCHFVHPNGNPCGGVHCFPYAYLEQERMHGQLELLKDCAVYYSKQSNPEVAVESLNNLAKVAQRSNGNKGLHILPKLPTKPSSTTKE